MAHSYALRTIDQIDGHSEADWIKPSWKSYDWPKAPNADKARLESDPSRGAYRLDGGREDDGWWALDDLIRVTAGFDREDLGKSWYSLAAADLVKVMTVFRMIGADSRLEVCLPPAYADVLAENQRADDQVRAAVRLSAKE